MCTRESISALGDPFYIGESITSLCTRGPRSRKKSACFGFKPVSKRFHSRVGRFHRSRVSQGIRMYVAWRMNFCTGESICVLEDKFLYWRINFCTRESISVLGNLFLHGGINHQSPYKRTKVPQKVCVFWLQTGFKAVS